MTEMIWFIIMIGAFGLLWIMSRDSRKLNRRLKGVRRRRLHQ